MHLVTFTSLFHFETAPEVKIFKNRSDKSRHSVRRVLGSTLRVQFRMWQVEVRRILIGFGQRHHFGFAEELSQERQAKRSSRATSFHFAVLAHPRLGCVL